MNVEIMIYVYIAICISMILYNIVYIFILRHREKALGSNSARFEEIISAQLERVESGEMVSDNHKKYLQKKLQRTAGITAFDKALGNIHESEPEICEKYLIEIYSVFEFLTFKYIGKDTIKIAYFPYILQKYDVLKNDKEGKLREILFELLRSMNVYCRENSLKAIYGTGNEADVAQALNIIDKNLSFHHPKLVCDGLFKYKGDKGKLKDKLFEKFDRYSVDMQLNILNYFRFANVRCDEEMRELLANEKSNRELRFSAIRYFEKFPDDEAEKIIRTFAENKENRTWEYQAIASSALKAYPGNVSFRILVENLSSSNWYVRQNSAVSLEKLGYTYQDLINVFDGDDRYAREIMRYRLDRRNAESEAMKV